MDKKPKQRRAETGRKAGALLMHFYLNETDVALLDAVKEKLTILPGTPASAVGHFIFMAGLGALAARKEA